MQGIEEIEHFDKDGNLIRTYRFVNEIIPHLSYVKIDPPIEVHSNDTLRITFTYTLCSDCKDGYYYPLIGPREPCKTCDSK